MIPLLDNLLTLSLPSTPLTTILTDFRSYRPGNHRQFLAWVSAQSVAINLKGFALDKSHPTSNLWYLRALDQVREFRWRHWCFTREYILKRTSHPTATGGSPIVRWLPNQLTAVLEGMCDVGKVLGVHEGDQEAGVKEDGANGTNGVTEMPEGLKLNGNGTKGHGEALSRREMEEIREIIDTITKQKRELEREVRKWCEERGEKA